MNIVEESHQKLYPEKIIILRMHMSYSGKFKPYNANVRLSSNTLIFNLSKAWRPVSREIKIGLIQTLLIKVLKDKKHTLNMDLYSSFIKNISSYSEVNHIDPYLEKSFDRVNNKYFLNILDKPNLKWGQGSTRKLGCYEYQTDTIKISTIFKDSMIGLDYVMYHEMLHKKHKFHTKNGRSHYHTPQFKKDEKKFESIKIADREIKMLCKTERKTPTFFKLLKKARNNLI